MSTHIYDSKAQARDTEFHSYMQDNMKTQLLISTVTNVQEDVNCTEGWKDER